MPPPWMHFNSGFPRGPGLVQQLPEISAISAHDVELVRKGSVPGEQEHNTDLNPSFLIGPAGSESFCLCAGRSTNHSRLVWG